MKICITSDVHYGHTSKKRVEHLVHNIIQSKPDIIILAGDNAEPGNNNMANCLDIFNKSSAIKGLILGNHDLWKIYSDHPSTNDLWECIYPNLAKEKDFIWMEDEIIYFDNIAIIGSIAWYDYSNAESFTMLSDNFYYSQKKKYNNDGRFITWGKTDIEFAKECRENLIKRLQICEDDPNIDTVIVVTHVPIFSQQMVSSIYDDPRGNAYFGHFTLGKEVLKFDKVKHVVSGHTHRGIKYEIDGLTLETIGSDYGKPTYIQIEI